MWGEYLLLWKISIALLSMWKVQNIGKNIFEVAGHPNWNFALVFRHSCSSQSSSTVWLCHGCCRPSLLLPLNAPWSCILCTVSILTPPPYIQAGLNPLPGRPLALPVVGWSQLCWAEREHKAQLSHCCRCNPASILYQHLFFSVSTACSHHPETLKTLFSIVQALTLSVLSTNKTPLMKMFKERVHFQFSISV